MTTSPLVVDITPLKRSPATQRPFNSSVQTDGVIALETAEVVAREIHLALIFEFAGEELVVSGQIGVDWTGPCRRCLEDQDERTDIDVREIFQKVAVEGETYPLDEDSVNLEPMVREAVLLHLPVAPLCAEDCAGPDPERFPTTVVVEPDDLEEEERPTDPRWAALGELTFDE